MGAFVKFENVKKVYQMGEIQIEALRDATFEIGKGETCVIVGPSGAGKTTLLNILGGMDTLTSGNVWLDGEEISKYNSKQLTTYRRYAIGFVFQFYNLVQNLTALENVSLATQICKNPMDSAEALRKVGLGERLNNFPSQLSGGEQQRGHCQANGYDSHNHNPQPGHNAYGRQSNTCKERHRGISGAQRCSGTYRRNRMVETAGVYP